MGQWRYDVPKVLVCVRHNGWTGLICLPTGKRKPGEYRQIINTHKNIIFQLILFESMFYTASQYTKICNYTYVHTDLHICTQKHTHKTSSKYKQTIPIFSMGSEHFLSILFHCIFWNIMVLKDKKVSAVFFFL